MMEIVAKVPYTRYTVARAARALIDLLKSIEKQAVPHSLLRASELEIPLRWAMREAYLAARA